MIKNEDGADVSITAMDPAKCDDTTAFVMCFPMVLTSKQRDNVVAVWKHGNNPFRNNYLMILDGGITLQAYTKGKADD